MKSVIEFLKLFTCPPQNLDGGPKHICQPFNIGDHTYATDRCIIVRVPLVTGAPEIWPLPLPTKFIASVRQVYSREDIWDEHGTWVKTIDAPSYPLPNERIKVGAWEVHARYFRKLYNLPKCRIWPSKEDPETAWSGLNLVMLKWACEGGKDYDFGRAEGRLMPLYPVGYQHTIDPKEKVPA